MTHDLPNKRTRQTPRKSSTNTRALSTRIANIQKEINPYIHLKGGTAQGVAVAVYVDRKCQGEFPMSSSLKTVTENDLAGIIPDGAKILGMKISNINGRKLAVNIPSNSFLVLNEGSPGALSVAMNKVVYAPLSRFPSIKVEIPDLIAKNIDTSTASPSPLFKLATDGASDRVVVHFHYKQAI